MPEKKIVGGSRQNKRTLEKRLQEGVCKYCGNKFTRLMFPGPNPEVCPDCMAHHKQLKREQAKERMRTLRENKKTESENK